MKASQLCSHSGHTCHRVVLALQEISLRVYIQKVQPVSQFMGFKGICFSQQMCGEAGAGTSLPRGQGRGSWLPFRLCRAVSSRPAEGMVPFQQLQGISNCLASPKTLQMAFRGVERIPAPDPEVCLVLGPGGGGGSKTHTFARSKANWLSKSAVQRFLLLKSGICCTAPISQDLGAAGT